MRAVATAENPLNSLEEWDDFVASRYQEGKDKSEFRVYDPKANPGVAEFYRLNHANQTLDFVLGKKKEYLGLNIGKKTVWEAAEFLNTLVDDSDPDTDLSQVEHLLQTSEAIRRDGKPRWMVLTGFIHDLGKVLCLYGEPQWAVVGDTFPVGCAWSDQIVFPEYFAANPDAKRPRIPDPIRHLLDLTSASTTCTSPGDTTNISTTSSRTTCPSRRYTCSATTPSTPPTSTEPTGT